MHVDAGPPPGVELRAVVDREGVMLVAVHDEVFADSALGAEPLIRLESGSDTDRPAVAAGETPISAEFHDERLREPLGRRHAGGAASRAACSARWWPTEPRSPRSEGFRYLQVDASPDSRPILKRSGSSSWG